MFRPATSRLTLEPRWVEDFCKRNGIRRLALYGSVLREDFRSSSDVDVLIDLEPDARVGFIGLASMEQELSDMIGRKIDLRTPAELSRYFRQRVLDSAEVLYERR
jgi:predicted nucleotidyltransferase